MFFLNRNFGPLTWPIKKKFLHCPPSPTPHPPPPFPKKKEDFSNEKKKFIPFEKANYLAHSIKNLKKLLYSLYLYFCLKTEICKKKFCIQSLQNKFYILSKSPTTEITKQQKFSKKNFIFSQNRNYPKKINFRALYKTSKNFLRT